MVVQISGHLVKRGEHGGEVVGDADDDLFEHQHNCQSKRMGGV